MYDLAMNINTTWPFKALQKISDITGDVSQSKNIGKFFDQHSKIMDAFDEFDYFV
jgi:hypothetical protein